MNQNQLLELLDQRFDSEELRDLCFLLDVDYDNLAGDGKRGKARALITYLSHREELDKLLQGIKVSRPRIDLSSFGGEGPSTEPSLATKLAANGLINAFRIPADRDPRLKRVCQLIDDEFRDGKRKLRLSASSGHSYLSPNGPVWGEKLGALVENGDLEVLVILESPFSTFAQTRALANQVTHHHWEEKLQVEDLVKLLDCTNVEVRVTGEVTTCSLFFTSHAVFYDPYLWGRPNRHAKNENNFWVFEFAKCDSTGKDCYGLLEKHFAFLEQHSISLEEFLCPSVNGKRTPRGPSFYKFFERNRKEALGNYSEKTQQFHAVLATLLQAQSRRS